MTSSTQTLSGKVILITGATDGIGLEAAYKLATRGAKVIIHARTAQRGTATIQDLHTEDPVLDLEIAVPI